MYILPAVTNSGEFEAKGEKEPELTEFAVDAVVAGRALAEEAVEQGEANSAVAAGIGIARAGQAVVDLGVVLGDIDGEVLVSFLVHHDPLDGAVQARASTGQAVHLVPVSARRNSKYSVCSYVTLEVPLYFGCRCDFMA